MGLYDGRPITMEEVRARLLAQDAGSTIQKRPKREKGHTKHTDVEAIVKNQAAPLDDAAASSKLAQAKDETGEPHSTHTHPALSRLADLLDEIAHQITSYVRLPKSTLAMLIAIWLAGTYTFRSFRYCGYLALRSATVRCGKTTLLRVLSQLANGSPPISSMPTPAILFRSKRPVLLLDEVDKLRNAARDKYGEVMAVLNVGFEQGGVIDRCNRNTFEVEHHTVYGPKALAGIEGVADTLADRSFQFKWSAAPPACPA